MKNKEYYPEGAKNYESASFSYSSLQKALDEGKILQAHCYMCDKEHNLHLKLSQINAIIPKDEAALGIKDGSVKDVAIITRVNKTVCFKVLGFENGVAILSRAAAQKDCLDYILKNVECGDVLDAKVTHLEQFGAFCDIGCGITSLIPIDSISVSRIEHPSARLETGMDIKVVVTGIDEQNARIFVSHKELLGTWEQNAACFMAGQTVGGIVRSVESYGIFIELLPNLAGLAEISDGVCAGDRVSVYIKSIIPEKMKVKLAIVDTIKGEQIRDSFDYFFTGDHIDFWDYSPVGCKKVISTTFGY